MDFSLEKKISIVTGCNGLLGTFHCEALSNAGAFVVGIDVDEKLNEKNKFVDKYFSGDVTDKESLININDVILDDFSSIDILVNNAAINDMVENNDGNINLSKFENFPLEVWQQGINVNITGVFLCCQIFGKSMTLSGGGSIINIGSTYGLVGPDQNIYKNDKGEQSFFKGPIYPASKGAVTNFTRYLAAYWGNKNIRVNTLSPGGVKNNQDETFIKKYSEKTLLGRMADPADYQGALIFLASDASKYMTGSNLIVDGGWTSI